MQQPLERGTIPAPPRSLSDATPLVSVIVPTYNRALVLPRAVESALGQSYPNTEIIIVDDRSTDGTPELLAQYTAARDIRVIHNERRHNAAGARNSGIEASNGELIAFLDSDDAWRPDKLLHQVSRLTTSPSTVGAIYSSVEAFYPGGKTFTTPAELSGNIYRELLVRNRIGSASRLMVRRSVLDDVGLFDEAFNTLEDWELVLRIARRYAFERVPDVDVQYFFESDDHLSLRSRQVFLARRKIAKAFSPTYQPRARRSSHLSQLAVNLDRLGRKTLARRFILESLTLSPWERAPLRTAYRFFFRLGQQSS